MSSNAYTSTFWGVHKYEQEKKTFTHYRLVKTTTLVYIALHWNWNQHRNLFLLYFHFRLAEHTLELHFVRCISVQKIKLVQFDLIASSHRQIGSIDFGMMCMIIYWWLSPQNWLPIKDENYSGNTISIWPSHTDPASLFFSPCHIIHLSPGFFNKLKNNGT